jgi:alkylation response protein AidB-like acyl-CoA dehydrogenase
MNFEFLPEELEWQAKVMAYADECASKPGVRVKGAEATRYIDTDARRGFMKDMSKGGYLGVSWPKELGGKGLNTRYDYLLNEAMAYINAPSPGKGIGIIGRSMMKHGTPEQKAKFLPLILNAEIEWAIGYSEPEAGSDLASLKIKATRDGDGWRINGQKRFTTSAHFADWYYLATRTDASGPKHKGITMFLIDLKNTPGIQVNPMYCINGERTNEVFLDNVYVPDSQRFGPEGEGFKVISEALDFERHILFPHNYQQRIFDKFVNWVKTAKKDGEPVAKDPAIRSAVAKLYVLLEQARMHSLSVIALDGYEAAVAAAQTKITSSELFQHMANVISLVIGPQTMLRPDAAGELEDGLFELIHRAGVILTVGAGANEIQRNIIARRGLGLPNPT